MQALVRFIILSAGWPRHAVAFLAGACGALALAPIDIAPAMIIPMTVAVWLIDGTARRERPGLVGRLLQPRSCLAAAGTGWWWGFGYFVAGFWWLGAAFLVEPEKDAWALPFGVLGVPAVLALFPAFGFAVSRVFWRGRAGRILALVVGLGLSEWLRAHLFTGFPWNHYGMALGDSLLLAQAASVIGGDGLLLLSIALCAAPATLADGIDEGIARRWTIFAPTIAAALGFVGLAGFGLHRLTQDDAARIPGVRLRLVQPNLPEDDSFSYANRDKIVADYLALSNRATGPDQASLADVTHVIWPESAFPFILQREPAALDTIGKALPAGTILITGAARLDTSDQDGARYYNAVQVIGSGGILLDSYDKVHLVPFGEYLPLGAILRRLGLTNFVHIPGGFTAGRQHRLLDVPGLPPISPMICYEAIFPDEALPPASTADRARAGAFLNVTNDGWFGQTSGPYQHLAQARLRSIEFGLPLIRAANSGVSAVIDPYGRIVASLPLGARNVLDAPLPVRLPPTLFARFQHYSNIAFFTLLILLDLGNNLTSRRR